MKATNNGKSEEPGHRSLICQFMDLYRSDDKLCCLGTAIYHGCIKRTLTMVMFRQIRCLWWETDYGIMIPCVRCPALCIPTQTALSILGNPRLEQMVLVDTTQTEIIFQSKYILQNKFIVLQYCNEKSPVLVKAFYTETTSQSTYCM